MKSKAENKIAVFENKEIRKTFHEGEWWFVINDVVAVLTDSKDVRQYIKRLRARDIELNEAFKGGVQFVPPLGMEFETQGGNQMLQCWNTEGIFRLIQSIPSPKAEPFKRWLAKVAAKKGGEVAGSARKDLEDKTGKKITTDENYIDVPEKVKRLKGKK